MALICEMTFCVISEDCADSTDAARINDPDLYAGPTLLVIDELGYLPLPRRSRLGAVSGCLPTLFEDQHRDHHRHPPTTTLTAAHW